jgi:hypothetical protein
MLLWSLQCEVIHAASNPRRAGHVAGRVYRVAGQEHWVEKAPGRQEQGRDKDGEAREVRGHGGGLEGRMS